VHHPVRSLAAALAAASLLLVGCGSNAGTGSAPSTTPKASSSPSSGTITVLAAASLTESFAAIGKEFEAKHPGVTVRFSFAASSTLATQIIQGAPADVFASASPKNMQQVVDAKAAGTPATFARNTLEVAVPANNPANITQVTDLARPGVKVAVCAEAVPAGAGAKAVFGKAKITVRPATVEADVKAILSKVRLGEVDAGIVWVTDVHEAGAKVKGIPIPTDLGYSSTYPIASLASSKNPELAEAFVAEVLSPDGAAALTRTGFQKP
jgi:molybdate transport system substrate-binding protein